MKRSLVYVFEILKIWLNVSSIYHVMLESINGVGLVAIFLSRITSRTILTRAFVGADIFSAGRPNGVISPTEIESNLISSLSSSNNPDTSLRLAKDCVLTD